MPWIEGEIKQGAEAPLSMGLYIFGKGIQTSYNLSYSGKSKKYKNAKVILDSNNKATFRGYRALR